MDYSQIGPCIKYDRDGTWEMEGGMWDGYLRIMRRDKLRTLLVCEERKKHTRRILPTSEP